MTKTTPAEVTFDTVAQQSATYLTTSKGGEPPPAGFKLGEPPNYYSLTTTATFAGSIAVCINYVCINYTGTSFGDESNLRLFHFEGGSWVDRTVSLDTVNKIICASVTSLSPFAVFRQTDFTPPNVSITATPSILWPPNHKIISVTIGGHASDQESGIASKSFKVTDEYRKLQPVISDFGNVIQLEAWRNGTDLDGRTYTISVTATDKAGNQATASTMVVCPHDQGKK